MTRNAFPLAAALPLLVLLSCTDADLPTAAAPESAARAIADATTDGSAYLYWLPPILPAPSYSGEFDAAAKPRVGISRCMEVERDRERVPAPGEPADGAGERSVELVCNLVATSGSELPAATIVSRKNSDPYYTVRWSTRGLDITPFYRVEVAGCIDGRMPAPPRDPGDPDLGTQAQLSDERELESCVPVPLGYADVRLVSHQRQLSLVEEGYVGVVAGRFLDINFRIEKGWESEFDGGQM